MLYWGKLEENRVSFNQEPELKLSPYRFWELQNYNQPSALRFEDTTWRNSNLEYYSILDIKNASEEREEENIPSMKLQNGATIVDKQIKQN